MSEHEIEQKESQAASAESLDNFQSFQVLADDAPVEGMNRLSVQAPEGISEGKLSLENIPKAE